MRLHTLRNLDRLVTATTDVGASQIKVLSRLTIVFWNACDRALDVVGICHNIEIRPRVF